MLKLLPFILIPILILGGLGYWRFVASNNLATPSQSSNPSPMPDGPMEVPKTLPQASLENRVKALEDLVNKLVTEVNKLKSPSPSANPDTKLNLLDTSVTDLKLRVAALEKGGTTTSATKAPLYIPFGSGGSSSDSNWASISNYQISLDPKDYAGYSSMQLEVNMKLPDLVGTAYARLYNSTDATATSNELSTTSGNFVWLTSGTFTLPTGNKTYKLQLKSSDSKTIEVQSARIKVTF